MLNEFENLSVKQIELLFDAPVLVTLWVASADGKIDASERNLAMEIAHIKSFSEKENLKEFYHHLENEFERRMNYYLANLPQDGDEMRKELERKLSELNPIMAQLPYKFAHNLYLSLKNFMVHVANASGGFFGFKSISPEEKEALHLNMVEEPTHHTE